MFSSHQPQFSVGFFLEILHPYLISSRIKSWTWTNQSMKMMTPNLAGFPLQDERKSSIFELFHNLFSNQTPQLVPFTPLYSILCLLFSFYTTNIPCRKSSSCSRFNWVSICLLFQVSINVFNHGDFKKIFSCFPKFIQTNIELINSFHVLILVCFWFEDVKKTTKLLLFCQFFGFLISYLVFFFHQCFTSVSDWADGWSPAHSVSLPVCINLFESGFPESVFKVSPISEFIFGFKR